jgi:Tol biopolymer transport system component
MHGIRKDDSRAPGGPSRFIRRAFACAMVVVALSTVSSAQTDFFGKNKVQYKQFRWDVLRTPHFDINFPEGYRDLAARTAVILEFGYNKLSTDFSHHIDWRIPVIVYGSQSDFQQTNVLYGLIPEGVQAFAEPIRKRIVVFFGGSNVEYVHTVVHELVHLFSYDIIYSTLLRSVFSQNLLFPIPLWFMEGLAEYYSSGYDETAEMFMRDAAVFDYLTDLDETGGYMAYKAGQAAIYYLSETYGPGKIIEIMDNLRNQRGSTGMALQTSLGISSEELSRDWKKAMRKRYWPLYADKKEPEAYGRRLTDHVKKHNGMNTKPAFSPDGDYVVYFSDLKGLDGIYLMNVVTGNVEKRLITGMMSTRFESIRSMNSSLTYSPDGTRIAFVAKSHGYDRLFIMKVPEGKVLEEIGLELDFFRSPAWSPSGDAIALIGVKGGQTDLFLYDLAQSKLTRLTDDPDDEESPAWFPDGTALAYGHYAPAALQPSFQPDSSGVVRLSGVDFANLENVRKVDSDIWRIDIATGERKLLIHTDGNDDNPIVLPGGTEILFTSDESGVTNLYRGSTSVGSYYRFTDLLGGVFSQTFSPGRDRLVYSAFNAGGLDLFIMDSFSEKSKTSFSTGSPLMAKLSQTNESAEAGFELQPAAVDTAARRPEALPSLPDTSRSASGTTVGGTGAGEIGGIYGAAGREIRSAEEKRRAGAINPGELEETVPQIVVDEDSKEDINPDTLAAIRKRLSREIGTVQRYHAKFAPDYVGDMMGIGYSTGFGFQLYNQIAFSDLLGDHHIGVAFNFFRSIEDSDIILTYEYLKRRIDYGVGIFQLKNYLNSRVSSIGEVFLDYQLFTERNYGVFGLASYPFSTFTRVDLEFEGFVSEREFFGTYREDSLGFSYYVPEKSVRHLLQPTLSLVHDSAYFGSFGPVIGRRWMLSASRAFAITGADVSRSTFFGDVRQYLPLFYRNYLALRAVGAVSTGNDPQFFFLGGPLTMRGYDYLQFTGSRMLLFNVEYRYPLVDALIFGWPGRWGFQDIGGTLFFDTGSVWGEGRYVEPLPSWLKPRIVDDLAFYSDFGMGFYMRFGYFILNFQLGWPTDFNRTGSAMFHFFIGPMF